MTDNENVVPNVQRRPLPFVPPSHTFKQAPSVASFKSDSAPLEPVSTVRLKPIQQQTKYGRVEITPSGHVVLDFTGEPFRLVVSPDGQTVIIFILFQ